MKEKEIKKVQEKTREQILKRVKSWLEIKQKYFDETTSKESKIRLAGEVSALCQIAIEIEFMIIK